MARSRGKNGEINKEEDQGNSEAGNVTKESNKAVAGARKKDTISNVTMENETTPVRDRQRAPPEETVVDEFPIPLDQLEALKAVEPRIDELFSVKVQYTLQHQDRFKPMQWLNLIGLPGDITKAKEYVKAASQPELTQVIDLPAEVEPILQDKVLHNSLEIQAMAVIKFLPDHKAEISGSNTGVILATSAIEDKISNLCVDLTGDSSDSDNDDDDLELISHTGPDKRKSMMLKRQASERLNNELRRICDLDETLMMDEEQLNSILHMPNEVKRTMISVFNEERETATKSSDTALVIDDDDDTFEFISVDTPEMGETESPTCVDLRQSERSLDSLNKTLTENNASPPKEDVELDIPIIDISMSKIPLPADWVSSSIPRQDESYHGPGASATKTGSGDNAERGATVKSSLKKNNESLSVIPNLGNVEAAKQQKEPVVADNRSVTSQSKRGKKAKKQPAKQTKDEVVKQECKRREKVAKNTKKQDIDVTEPEGSLTEKELKEFAKKEGFLLEDITVALQQFPPNSDITKEEFRCALEAQLALKKIMEDEVERMSRDDVEMLDETDDRGARQVMPPKGAPRQVTPPVGAARKAPPTKGAANWNPPSSGARQVTPPTGANRQVTPPTGAVRWATPPAGAAGQTSPPAGLARRGTSNKTEREPLAHIDPVWMRGHAQGATTRSPQQQQKKQRLSGETEIPDVEAAPKSKLTWKEKQKKKQKETRSALRERFEEYEQKRQSKLRPIIIDACNVAMSHGTRPGKGAVFSCRGIEIVIEYFKKRGHQSITGFLPRWRVERAERGDMKDHHLLLKMVEEEYLVCTPSRRLTTGETIASYDDRYIVRLAADTGGIVVSNDYFRDLHRERREWREVIDKRVLQYSFHGDIFMPPDDPLGRLGPNLDDFLKFAVNTNIVHTPRSLARSEQGGQGYPGAPAEARYTGAPVNNFRPVGPPVQPTIPLYNRFNPVGILGACPQGMQPLPQVNQTGGRGQGQGQPAGMINPWRGAPMNITGPHSQGNVHMNTAPPGQNLAATGRNSTPTHPQVKERQQLEKQLNEIYPDSQEKIKKVLKKFPHETNANVLCTYLLENNDFT